MKSTKVNRPPTSPCNGAISVESRRKWLDFCDFVNEGLARPYTPSAIGNRIFEVGVNTVMNAEHREGWRNWIRKELLSVQTQHRTQLTPEDLTQEEDVAIRRYCDSVELSPEVQKLLDDYEIKRKNMKRAPNPKARKKKETETQ